MKIGLKNHVTMLGYSTQIQKYLNICNVLIACSFREGLPVNLMEAMLCGKPIVASDNRGHRELIKDGWNGYLVQAQDTSTFAAKICDILLSEKDYTCVANEAVQLFTDVNVKNELKKIYQL